MRLVIFLGTFVLQELDNKFQIIDGQQRITTLMLILSSLCAVFNEMKDEEEHGMTRQYLIGNIGLKSEYCRMENTDITNIASIIESVSEYRENIDSIPLLDNSIIDKRKKGNREILDCFYFFYNYLKDNFNNVADLIGFRDVLLDMKVIHIASEDELDCYDIFEILNARGVDLEDSELLKNYIFKYAQPKYSIDRAKDIWNKIENNIHCCNDNMELFISHFVSYRFTRPSKEEGAFKIIKANTDKQNVNKLLDELLNASEKYILFYHPEECNNETIKECLAFFKLIKHRQFRPLFLAFFDALEKNYFKETDICDIFSFLMKFSFGYTMIVGNNSNAIDKKVQTWSENIYLIHNVEIIKQIKDELRKYYPTYNEFKNGFLRFGFSNKNKKYCNSNNRKRMFYILKKIEEYNQNTNELVCNVDECNIEHIMNDSDFNETTSMIGNLLLLSEHINNKMGNASFSEKKSKLKKSHLESVKTFLSNYGHKDEWTEDDILKRTQYIAKMSYEKIWKLI